MNELTIKRQSDLTYKLTIGARGWSSMRAAAVQEVLTALVINGLDVASIAVGSEVTKSYQGCSLEDSQQWVHQIFDRANRLLELQKA